ncbi:MAG: hypothetical protein HDS68_06685 [Bacteroidales bacterium]|nr:hypothetical protein [Bacteroidales bacterium]
MVKKISIAAIGLLAAFAATGRTLTPEEALSRLRTDNMAMRATAAATAQPKLIHTSFTTEGTPATYIFNSADNKGFMILPADDKAAPLLGYGDRPVKADAMPPQLVWWLNEYAQEIESYNASGDNQGQSYAATSARTAAPSKAADRTAIAPLLTTIWNQDEPFNNLCPRSGLNLTYTGCVATAMAQVMKYHNYPDKGTGTGTCTVVNSYGVETASYTMDLGVEFDWANMADSYNGNYTTAQGEAVATLMKACGYSVSMAYSTSASGAQSNAVPVALVDNFGYDKGCRFLERNHYPLTEWEQMVYDNLRDCGPVYYSGQAISGGHAFVCDGYSTDGYFHFNWGWGGAYDGYFRLTALEPEGEGIGGFSGGYNTEQTAVFGIRKPVAGSELPQLQLTQISSMTADEDGSRVLLDGPWANYNGRTMNTAFSLEFEPVDGGSTYTRQLYTYTEVPVFQGFSQFSFPKSYMSSLANGSYKLRILTQNEGSDKWLPVLHNINIPDYVVITKNGGTLTYVNPQPNTLTCVSAEFTVPFCFYTTGKISIEVKNDTDSEVPANVSVALLSGSTVVARSGGSFFDLLPGISESRDFEFVMTYSDSFSYNTTYDIALYDTMSGKILKKLGTAHTSVGTQPTITCQNFAMEGSTTAASLDNINFNATFTCTQGSYANDIVVGIFPTTGGNAVADGVAQETLFLNTGESAESHFHLDLSTICSLNTYYLALPYYVNYRLAVSQLTPQLLPAADDNQVIRFKATAYSGIEAVDADDAELRVYYNSPLKTAVVNGAADITGVTVFTADGTLIPAATSADGATVTVDLSTAPAGVAIIHATDTSGNTVTSKIMVR